MCRADVDEFTTIHELHDQEAPPSRRAARSVGFYAGHPNDQAEWLRAKSKQASRTFRARRTGIPPRLDQKAPILIDRNSTAWPMFLPRTACPKQSP